MVDKFVCSIPDCLISPPTSIIFQSISLSLSLSHFFFPSCFVSRASPMMSIVHSTPLFAMLTLALILFRSASTLRFSSLYPVVLKYQITHALAQHTCTHCLSTYYLLFPVLQTFLTPSIYAHASHTLFIFLFRPVMNDILLIIALLCTSA